MTKTWGCVNVFFLKKEKLMFKYLIALLVCFSSLKAADCDSTFYLYIYFYEGDKDMLKLEMNACQTIDELKNLIYY